MLVQGVHIPEDRVAEFCKRHSVKRLSLYGSILGADFGPSSDVDMLIEFLPGKTPGMLGFAGMTMELSEMIGRRVDLRTPDDLSRYFRGEVIKHARTLHAA